MRSASVVAVIAVLVVASLGAGYLVGGGIQKAETRTITSTATIANTVTTTTTIAKGAGTSVSSSSSSSSSPGRLTGPPVLASTLVAANFSLEDMNGGYHEAVYDANASRIYALGVPLWVDDSVNYSLAVIDTSNDTLVANVSLPNTAGLSFCSNLAVDGAAGMVYAIMVGDDNNALFGKMVTFDASTNSIAAEIPLNFTFLVSSGFSCGLGEAQFDPGTHLLWAQFGTGVAAVNVLTGAVDESVRLPFAPQQIVVDPAARMVYALGCIGATADSCGSQQLAIINGTGVSTVGLNSSAYGTMALDQSTNVVYVSGGSQLVALNGTDGGVIFKANSETCGSTAIEAIPSLDQVVMLTSNHPDYLLFYDGATGALANMYSFPSRVGFAGSYASIYDTNTGELYLSTGPDTLVALHYDAQTMGNLNATLIEAGCPAP
ncbi:MAG: hypothetical protein JRN58_02825 [Nitrososphaerota archaeon]|nr:hypothetical protein [Nitrososphaerota archaeon]